jgi:hypothetical protein
MNMGFRSGCLVSAIVFGVAASNASVSVKRLDNTMSVNKAVDDNLRQVWESYKKQGRTQHN